MVSDSLCTPLWNVSCRYDSTKEPYTLMWTLDITLVQKLLNQYGHLTGSLSLRIKEETYISFSLFIMFKIQLFQNSHFDLSWQKSTVKPVWAHMHNASALEQEKQMKLLEKLLIHVLFLLLHVNNSTNTLYTKMNIQLAPYVSTGIIVLQEGRTV